jgi:hypothetical protein
VNIIDLTKDIASSKASEVREKLHNEFQRELFDAAIANLLDHDNKLRINNFSYAARELIRIYLSSVVDDDEVSNCSWFKGDKNKNPTRTERMRYAIHRGLDVQTVAEILGSDHNALIRNLIKNIDLLSKYTHISEDTFPTNTCDNDLALTLLENLAEFLNNIIDAERNIANSLEKEIWQVLENGFFNEYFDEIDHLATHHGIEEVYVNSILAEQFDSKNLTFSVEGTLEFSLQWGSDSDMRKGDGATGGVSVKFSAIVKADIEDIMRLEVVSYSLDEDEELKVKFYDEE